MAFPQESTKTPTTIGDIFVHLKRSSSGQITKELVYEVIDNDGEKRVRTRNIESDLTGNQNNTINSFMGTIYNKLEDEAL